MGEGRGKEQSKYLNEAGKQLKALQRVGRLRLISEFRELAKN